MDSFEWSAPVDWVEPAQESPPPPSTDCIRDHGPEQSYVRGAVHCNCGQHHYVYGCRACDEERDGKVIYDAITNPEEVSRLLTLWHQKIKTKTE